MCLAIVLLEAGRVTLVLTIIFAAFLIGAFVFVLLHCMLCIRAAPATLPFGIETQSAVGERTSNSYTLRRFDWLCAFSYSCEHFGCVAALRLWYHARSRIRV